VRTLEQGGQKRAKSIQKILVDTMRREGRSANIVGVKAHAGTLGNERADRCAHMAGRRQDCLVADRIPSPPQTRISQKFRTAKDWHKDPRNYGTKEIHPRLPPKKSCLDRARNNLARTAAQIRTGHWRSAVYLKRIRKRRDDKCWYYPGPARMS
jgi:hypothetical protein